MSPQGITQSGVTAGWRPPLSIRASSLRGRRLRHRHGIDNTPSVDPFPLPAVVDDLLMLASLVLLISAVAAQGLGVASRG